MSFFVSLYVEYRPKGATEWKLAGEDSVTGYFRDYMVGEKGDWTDMDRFNSFDPVEIDSLSERVRCIYSKSLEGDRQIVPSFRAIGLADYEKRVDDAIDRHRDRFVTTLTALGLTAGREYDGELSVGDEWRVDESDSKKTAQAKLASQLTFPVSKELIYDLVVEDETYARALKNKGLLEAVREMVDSDSAEVRLLLVS